MHASLLGALIAVLAQTAAPQIPGFGRPWFERPIVKSGHRDQPTTAPKQVEKPMIVCNMPMVRPRADVDPKFVVEPPKDVVFHLRIIDSGCK